MIPLLPRPRQVTLCGGTGSAEVLQLSIDTSLPAQGYRLRISPRGVEIVGADRAGLFYGQVTLRQLCWRGAPPCCEILDYPDIPTRAVMLDVSRDKAPTLETLFAIVERLAAWKINHLQLYMEHTFAYARHGEVCSAADPYTSDELRALEAHCAAHHVELAANQNCLGHFERWLQNPRYASLARAPAGAVTGELRRPPTTLDPANPKALELVRELLAELLPIFRSPRVNIGLDEPWELCGHERLYLDWLLALQRTPELQDREVLVWGDILALNPEHAAGLPSNVTICEWGYEADHPFAERAAALAAAGRRFWLCPGTSSWLSVVGRGENARRNLLAAAEAALVYGAAGYMITDWGDQGHHQPFAVSETWLAYGAALAWGLAANRDLDLIDVTSAHVWNDPTGGLARALDLAGSLYRDVECPISNMSALARHFYYPQVRLGAGKTRGLQVQRLAGAAANLHKAQRHLAAARPGRRDAALLVEETRWALDLVAVLIEDATSRLAVDGSLALVPASVRQDFAARIGELTKRYRRLWLARNRRGGLDDSCAWLSNLQHAYATGMAKRGWGGLLVEA